MFLGDNPHPRQTYFCVYLEGSGKTYSRLSHALENTIDWKIHTTKEM